MSVVILIPETKDGFPVGLSFESAPFFDEQKKIIADIISASKESSKLAWGKLLLGSHAPAFFLARHLVMHNLTLDVQTKLLICSIARLTHGVLVTVIDILEMIGSEASPSDVMKLYSEGWYSEHGFKERWDWLQVNKDRTKWGKLV